MSPSRRRAPRVGACIWIAALLVALVASVSPLVPSASAIDPSPDPGASPTVDPSPTVGPAPTPTVDPTPTVGPAPTPTPDLPSPIPTDAEPSAAPPVPSATGSEPTVMPTLPEPFPLYPLVLPDGTSAPEPDTQLGPTGLLEGSLLDSPHLVEGLTSDTCGACHRTHSSSESGMLAAAYRDRLLKSAGEAYQGTDFSLCFECHSEAPFAEGTGQTSFDLHAVHLGEIAGVGSGGTDIEVPGAGQGNAICAECHYRLHATAADVDTKLVNFAPNVQPFGVELTPVWSAGSAAGSVGGSCTLTCHGQAHDAETYGSP